MRFATFNVFGDTDPSKYLDRRSEAIVAALFERGAPDIICLQEATEPVIVAIRRALDKHGDAIWVWDKLETLSAPEDREVAAQSGRLALVSRWPIVDPGMVRLGGYVDDGVMSALVETPWGAVRVYNVHCAGGTFGRPPSVVEGKARRRLEELTALSASMRERRDAKALVGGDFNFDANDPKRPELTRSPERAVAKVIDVWSQLRPDEVGATEDEHVNTFRAAMKLKPPEQRRRCRYDRILSVGLRPQSIGIIGAKAIQKTVLIRGKTAANEPGNTETHLFPSDHFGLVAEFDAG